MRVVCVSVTEAGRAMASRLPYEAVHGSAAEAVRRLWPRTDGLVLMLAVGAATRIVAPLLTDKHEDPAVVCVDEGARWAVALCGGHSGGANDLAREVAASLGAQAVVTTATDSAGVTPLDVLGGFTASGDIAGVTTAMLDGRAPVVSSEVPGWPPPSALHAGAGPERVVVSDRSWPEEKGLVILHPESLVAGVGCSTGAGAGSLESLLDDALAGPGLAAASVADVATIESRQAHEAVTALARPVRAYSAKELAAVPVPNPSGAVEGAVGTPSVAEAAALLCAGDGAQLVVTKLRSQSATVAIARRSKPRGTLAVVGLGPGDASQRTAAAVVAVRRADLVIGYGPYLEQAEDLTHSAQEIVRSAIGDEAGRAGLALTEASKGRSVALVCSGDPGVYAMASLVCELAAACAYDLEIDVVPGVTAANAAASLLGAPLGHDHAVVSLSDLLTPWETIARRVRAAAESDLVVAIYNPRSDKRSWQLEAALDIIREHRRPDTPVGLVTDAYRHGQHVVRTTLAEVDPSAVGMTSCVLVGASTTRSAGGRIFTPRGYVR